MGRTRRSLILASASAAAFWSVRGLAGAAELPPPGVEDLIHPPPAISWEKLSDLPVRPGFDRQPGLAGVFAGAHGDALLIAGGTSYPAGPPWEGGPRAWWGDVYVLERKLTPANTWEYSWVVLTDELPGHLAYGASVSLEDGVLCIGGAEVSRTSRECFLLRWNAATRRIEQEKFPPLPVPLACLTAVRVHDTVYAIGGSTGYPEPRGTRSFYALDLTRRGKDGFEWKSLAPWDGPGRIFPVAAASLEGEWQGIYLCGGRDPGQDPDFLPDLHRYSPEKSQWAILGDVVDPRGHPAPVMASPAFHVPPHHFVVVSGADAGLLRMLEDNSRTLDSIDPAEREQRLAYNRLLLENHPGYSRSVMAYDAQAGEWSHLGSFPGEAGLTNPVVAWDGAFVFPGGESAPGRRTGAIWQAMVSKKVTVLE